MSREQEATSAEQGAALIAGAAEIDITPGVSQFLFGYPHVKRWSTGVHDPLLSSALFLSDGSNSQLWVANDVIFVGRDLAGQVRQRIEKETGVPAGNIMVTATHTHSGPITVDVLSNEADTTVPKADSRYGEQLADGIVRSAVTACQGARAAEIGFAVADGSCVGGNRHDPAGPADPQVPVVLVRDLRQRTPLAVMMGCRPYSGTNTVADGFRQLYTPRPIPRDSPRTANLHNNLRRYRLLRGLTQNQLATRIGVNRQTIVNVEGNRSLPSILLSFRLAQTLSVPVTDLFHP